MWWPRKKRRHADQKAQKVSGSKGSVIVSLRVTASGEKSHMKAVEDFESRPHKAVSFVVERQGGAGME